MEKKLLLKLKEKRSAKYSIEFGEKNYVKKEKPSPKYGVNFEEKK